MDIAYLQEQGRRLEDAENWREALNLYRAAADEGERRGTPDAGLYSRIGDLLVRLDDVEGAVKSWEKAIEAFLLEGLSDNALAVCRKIVRYSPEREEIYLRMGQIRARQGLLIYARKHFLTYAEMVGMRGDEAEALRAMEELVSWVPSDMETRLFLAERLVAEGRREKALVYLREGYWRALWERNDEALEQIRPRILELDPGAELGLLPEDGEGKAAEATGGAGEQARRAEGGAWARILDGELRRRKEQEEEARRQEAEARAREEEARRAREEVARAREEPLRAREEAVPAGEGAAGTAGPGAAQGAGEEGAAAGAVPVGPAPAHTPPTGDAPGEGEAPPAPVHLGDLILSGSGQGRGGSGTAPGSDFTQLLARFKEKTARRPHEGEAQGHYDRGIANREMGLLDDAVVLFEKALEADPEFLPAIEMLGRCHLEKGEPLAAFRRMEVALDLPVQVEDDLLGIYYHLGQACQELGRLDEARDWYDRVFSLDINFLDVTTRLKALRGG